MTISEILAIVFISTLFLVALAAIVMEEKEEATYFKTWEK